MGLSHVKYPLDNYASICTNPGVIIEGRTHGQKITDRGYRYYHPANSPRIALVAFLRGVNVGGHWTFRPSIVAKELSE